MYVKYVKLVKSLDSLFPTKRVAPISRSKNLWASQLSEFPIDSQLSGAPNWCSVEAWCPVPFFLLEPKREVLQKKVAKWKSWCSSFKFFCLGYFELKYIWYNFYMWDDFKVDFQKTKMHLGFFHQNQHSGDPHLIPENSIEQPGNKLSPSSINFTSPTNHQSIMNLSRPYPSPTMSTSMLHIGWKL